MIELYYDDAPPSLNQIGTRGSHWAVNAAKKRWQAIFDGLLLASRLPRDCNRIHATAIVRLPTQRIRDEGNFRWLLEKTLGDALVNGRYLADDDAKRFTFGEVTFDRGPKRTTVQCQVNDPVG